jgi:RNA methyltransferase, TrmH family
MKITSLSNARIKQLVRLRQEKVRRATGLSLIDGWREIERARAAGVEFVEFYFCPEVGAKQAESRADKKKDFGQTPVCEVTLAVYEKIAFGDRREGVVAVIRPRARALADIAGRANPRLIVLEQVEKPGNLGAILRTADAAGIDAVIVCDKATDIYNPNCIRASVATVFSVPVVQTDNAAALAFLRQEKVNIVAAMPSGKTLYTVVDYKQPTAIVLGSEDAGLSDFWIQACDTGVKIPMQGQGDSLNVSAAAALLAYEIVRQRG